MEVKVWVEGMQRVVCGVSDKTTCQDLVFALAHATGKIGRFTLVEKWRDNERLLSPAEYPLKVLYKWGEYANDVKFILRHSDKDKKRQTSGRRKRDKADGMPPTVTLQDGKASSTALKKSLTFSGVHSHADFDLKHGGQLIHHAQQSSLPNGYDYAMPDLVSQGSNHRVIGNGRPPNEFKLGPTQYQKQIPSQKRENTSPSRSSLAYGIVPALERDKKDKAANHISGQNGRVPALEGHQNTANGSPVLTNGGHHHRHSPTLSDSPHAVERMELLRLLSFQENQLKDQKLQLNDLGKEIEVLPVLGDSELAHYTVIISKLEHNDCFINQELQELELVSWPDKVALAKTEQNALKSELSDLRENLAQIEQNLEENITKMSKQSQELTEESKKFRQKQVNLKSTLEKEIKMKTSELDKQNIQKKELEASLQSLEGESPSCDTSIVERKLQLADLEKDLREFNFENFVKVPSLLTVEGITSDNTTIAHNWNDASQMTQS